MKRIVCALLLLSLVFGLYACGGGTKELDAEKLTADLLASRAFSVTLEELPASKAGVFYGLPVEDVSGALMYHAAGVSKEQIAVFTAPDEEAARRDAETLRGLLAEWIESDRSYAPAEVPKLEKAVLRQSGVHVILVVADDPGAAADIVDKVL